MGGVKLSALIDAVPVLSFSGPGDREIRSIHYDSRTVKPGGLFVAIKGLQTDGSRFIEDAVRRGASAVITAPPILQTLKEISLIQVEDARRALALVSSAFWGHPSRQLFMVGITGTNGKTTTAYLIEAVLKSAGIPVGVIGTIDHRFAGKHFASSVTTPESADLMRILRDMVDHDATHVVLEVSSHAIDLDRVAACDFDIAVFTNLSQDHLDYHKDMATYWACKKRFFVDHLSRGSKSDRAVSVINWEDSYGRELGRDTPVKTLRTGFSPECEIRAENVQVAVGKTTGTIRTPKGVFRFGSPLVGHHNVLNILSATAAGVAMGIPLSKIGEGISSLPHVPGRLESIPNREDLTVLVDYAHTPEALQNVLTALRGIISGRLITVFGCGGNRDKMKRPLMGKIAARLSDLCVLTTDNPRTESPLDILADIEAGTTSVAGIVKHESDRLMLNCNGKAYTVEPDRRRAIELGIQVAEPGDCVLIAGKGHEPYQIVGTQVLPFDDRLEATKVLGEHPDTQRGTGVNGDR